MEKEPDIDEIISRILDLRGGKRFKKIYFSIAEIRYLLDKAQKLILDEPGLLDLNGTFNIVGSIYGDLYDLFRTFEYGGLPPYSKYLFLGNYVDRGRYGIEGIVLLLALKVKYPQLIYLLRGSHEGQSINRIYGFYDEGKKNFRVKFWKEFRDIFNCFPFAAVVNDQIFCVNSGLSPELHDLEQIQNIQRPTDIPDFGMITDFLWSNPDESINGWDTSRGRSISYDYGPDVVKKFLDKNDLHLMVKGTQVVEGGYEYMFEHNRLISLFTGSNYVGQFDNFGAIMRFRDITDYDFQILSPKQFS